MREKFSICQRRAIKHSIFNLISTYYFKVYFVITFFILYSESLTLKNKDRERRSIQKEG
jgi:hypothetical protein